MYPTVAPVARVGADHAKLRDKNSKCAMCTPFYVPWAGLPERTRALQLHGSELSITALAEYGTVRQAESQGRKSSIYLRTPTSNCSNLRDSVQGARHYGPALVQDIFKRSLAGESSEDDFHCQQRTSLSAPIYYLRYGAVFIRSTTSVLPIREGDNDSKYMGFSRGKGRSAPR